MGRKGLKDLDLVVRLEVPKLGGNRFYTFAHSHAPTDSQATAVKKAANEVWEGPLLLRQALGCD